MCLPLPPRFLARERTPGIIHHNHDHARQGLYRLDRRSRLAQARTAGAVRKIAELTVREREIIALLAQGLQNKEVSQRLHITDNTVRRHLVAIFSKLDVESRLELVVYAFRHGLVKLPH